MSTTFIDTNKIPAVNLAKGQGSYAEILNRDLAGAKNVVGALRWLKSGDSLDTTSPADTHQLVYLMEGNGVITLEAKNYDVGPGTGVYLGPLETAVVKQTGDAPLKLLHLVVPKPGQ